jgi:hypothetical protein
MLAFDCYIILDYLKEPYSCNHWTSLSFLIGLRTLALSIVKNIPPAMVYQVAIAGISSKLALKVVAELLKKPDVQIRGSCREINKLPSFLKDSSRVMLIQCEPFDANTLRSLLRGCTIAICCYFADNKTMLDGQKLLIDLCEQEGVSRYMASDYTVDYNGLELGEIELKDPMKLLVSYLATKSKVRGVHILVGVFMEIFWEYLGFWNAQGKTLHYWGTGNEEWDLSTYQTAAEYVAAVALDPHAVGFKKCSTIIQSSCSLNCFTDLLKSVTTVNPSWK